MNIEQYLEELIKREGGYVNNPGDRGGATKYGITEAVARSNAYKGNMKDLPLDVAKAIYKKQYWTAPRFDQVNVISSLVTEELLDTGVNCGTGFAKPLLQRALNLLNNQDKAGWPDLTVDGVYGPATLNALQTYLTKRGKEGEKVLVRVLISCKGSAILKFVNAIQAKSNFSMGGSLTAFHFECSDFAMHSVFRMQSSHYQK
ncbi:hypothetical protein Acal01_00761 [Acinetobacter calcoaceticus]